ncbi:dUTP diphosphatase [Leptospira sp. GIMC2001]|uniref:dUTP diphosphatase n=1 Tax=Leptospira sp. GIMC2001 TaxID=1513297 RepID=UPI00234AB1EE|nr:dUTP diphosphatase [Leptospira sp. GIMC2001]WCL48084.1 dUTP diphosphatase [Leptospira sp. GIMC2001]
MKTNESDISVKIKINDSSLLPARQTVGSAGYDLSACLKDKTSILIQPQEVSLIPTGISVEIPIGYEMQVRPRSGLSSKNKLIVINSPGTIDSDYRGEIFVPIMNLGDKDFEVTHGMRIAQILLARTETIDWKIVTSLDNTDRSAGGFGSSGTH